MNGSKSQIASPRLSDFFSYIRFINSIILQKLQVGIIPSLNLSAIQQIKFLLDQIQFVDYDIVRNHEKDF